MGMRARRRGEGSPVRLLVADGARGGWPAGLSSLSQGRDIEVVGVAEDADMLADRFRRLRPDAVLVDPGLPHLNERHFSPLAPRAVVWIDDAGDEDLTRLIDAGVRGFVRRASPDLASVVRAVGRGGVAVGVGLAERLAPLLLRSNIRRIEAGASLELAREAFVVQIQELRESRASLEMARESLVTQLDELLETYRETVHALAAAVELRDEYTGGHIERVAAYARAVARELDPALADDPSVFGYMLHDVGKLALPDELLFNTGTLTREQFEVVKTHTVEGAGLVEGIPFLRPAVQIVRNHHERWDGRGYPDGLAREGIPPVVQVFTLADSLDAITTDRPYRAASSLEYAVEEITKKSGSQFAPDAVQAFLAVLNVAPAFAVLREGEVPGSNRLLSELRPPHRG